MSRRSRRLQRRNILKKKQTEMHSAIGSSTKDHSISESSGFAHTRERATQHSNSHRSDGFFRRIYTNNYKQLMVVPFVILLLALGLLIVQGVTTGQIMKFGVSVTGGVSITISDIGSETANSITEHLLSIFPDADISVRELTSGDTKNANIEASGVETEALLQELEKQFGSRNDFSVEETGSSLGQSFFKQSLRSLIIAFIIMGIVVFISFRTIVPSLAVILSAASDMIITMAIVDILGIRISTAGLAAFLMLIGYSVDTDILLTSRVLKGKGSIISRVFGAMNTGMTMTLTTVGAIFVAMLFSSSEVLAQIMLILLIGLVVDIMNTWIQNAGLIRIYAEKKLKE